MNSGAIAVQTIYDWITVGCFCALVILFLHRSVDVDEPRDKLWQYLVASAGCAGTDWLGNHGYHIVALSALTATLGFIYIVLSPFRTDDGQED